MLKGIRKKLKIYAELVIFKDGKMKVKERKKYYFFI